MAVLHKSDPGSCATPVEQGPFLANPHVILARSGPEINPPTLFEQGPFLANPDVILARSGPEIYPPTPVEQGPFLANPQGVLRFAPLSGPCFFR